MSRFYVYPYRTGSRSARALAEALEGRVIRLEGSRFRYRAGKTVINWGSCHCPPEYLALNPSSRTTVSRDKLRAFQTLTEAQEGVLPVVVPPFTTSPHEALEWVQKGTVIGRKSLTSQGGSDIIILNKNPECTLADIPVLPLYTRYIKKDAEYRVHLMKNREGIVEVIDIQRKVRDPDREPTCWKVRSHSNGFIFTRRNDQDASYMTSCPQVVKDQAILAMTRLGLDFAGIDVIWTTRNRAYVLEANSAIGMEGETSEIYAKAFKRRIM